MMYILAVGLGLLLAFLLILWLVLRTKPAVTLQSYDNRAAILTGSPIEYKLRSAIYEVEREVLTCEDEMESLCQFQLEILRDVGKPSYMEIADKPLFFKYKNPLRREDRYYYVVDLSSKLSEDELEERKKRLKNYAVHINLYRSKWEFFKRMQAAHNENLHRLESTEEGKSQLTKVRKMQQQQVQQQEIQQQMRMDIVATKSEHLLDIIGKELDHEEEYLRQYKALDAKYNLQPDIEAYQIYQEKLDDIIDKIEDETPKKQKK
jgi:hypothetical protein